MNRGEIWWVRFGPASGGEIRKTRPAIIVSTDAANRHLNRVQVVPVSSQVERLYPSEAHVTVQDRKGKAMADQLATVSKERLSGKIGTLDRAEMISLEAAIRTQLDLP